MIIAVGSLETVCCYCCSSLLLSAAAWPAVADSKLLKSCADGIGSASEFIAALRSSVSNSLQPAVSSTAPTAVLETGVACLLKFLQINLCG